MDLSRIEHRGGSIRAAVVVVLAVSCGGDSAVVDEAHVVAVVPDNSPAAPASTMPDTPAATTVPDTTMPDTPAATTVPGELIDVGDLPSSDVENVAATAACAGRVSVEGWLLNGVTSRPPAFFIGYSYALQFEDRESGGILHVVLTQTSEPGPGFTDPISAQLGSGQEGMIGEHEGSPFGTFGTKLGDCPSVQLVGGSSDAASLLQIARLVEVL